MRLARLAMLLGFLSTGALLTAPPVPAQVYQGAPRAPGTLESPNSRVLPVPTPSFIGDIQPNFVNSTPGWSPTIAPPEGAPNVLLILIDDAGYGSNSAFGGVVPTPTLEKLARRYTQTHNTVDLGESSVSPETITLMMEELAKKRDR